MTTHDTPETHTNPALKERLEAISDMTLEAGFKPASKFDTDTLGRLMRTSEAIATILRRPTVATTVIIPTCEAIELGPGYLRQFHLTRSGLSTAKSCGAEFSLSPSGTIVFRSPEQKIASPRTGVLPANNVRVPSAEIWRQCLSGSNIYLGAHALYLAGPLFGQERAMPETRPSLTEESGKNWTYLLAISATAATFNNIFSRIIEHPDFPHELYADLQPAK